MSNHLHLIIKAKEGYVLWHIIRDFKKFTSKQIVQKIQEIGESRKEWLLDKFNFGKMIIMLFNWLIPKGLHSVWSISIKTQ